jgi:uncharacterized small protein (DUF1192 family)
MKFSMEANTSHKLISRLLRLGISSASRASSDDPSAVGELETELALLREENAWLKVERHRPPDTGRVVERMRELGQGTHVQANGAEGSPAADAAQTMVDLLAMRDGLVEACNEVQQAMEGIRTRLSGLSVDVQGRAGERPERGPISTPSTGEVDLELAVGARANSNLSKNAA